jgi:glycosyltransferase involved in cell wall biosynthesis
MRVAIDIRRVREFGVGTYIWNLVHNLAALDTRNSYVLFGAEEDFQALGNAGPNFERLKRLYGSNLWAENVSLPTALRSARVDVVHIPHHERPFFLPGKVVMTVHDCVHIKFPPDTQTRFERNKLYWQTRRALRQSSRILVVSESTRKDLLHIFDIDDSRIAVVHNALDGRFAASIEPEVRRQALERYQLNAPFILYSGRIRPHKNLHRLIEAFAVLKNELSGDNRYSNLKLIIIGDELSKHQYLRLAVVRSGMQQDVRFFGFIPYPAMQVFYQEASLFALPSLYEGFGLSAIEALASRTPVLASNTSSLPEVLGDAALFVNPENVFEIGRGMKSILTDVDLRAGLVERGVKQVSRFSWREAAGQVLDAYESAADS